MNSRVAPIYADQILASYAPKDAIGSQVETMRAWLLKKGIDSKIFASQVTDQKERPAEHISRYGDRNSASGLTLFHFAVGSDIPYFMNTWKGFRVCFYHNITPPDFFDPVAESEAYYACLKGYYQLPTVCRHSEMGWTVSSYNASQMERAGFRDVIVTPIFKDYEALAQLSLTARPQDGRKTLLFVGRVNPNKGHHDLINLLVRYRDRFKDFPRLAFAGSPHPGYLARIVAQCKAAGLHVIVNKGDESEQNADVIFHGGLSDRKLSEVYRNSHAFVCFSDHEGFCVPIVEAMSFGLPVIAHNSSAVPETCNGGALIVNKAQLEECVDVIHRLLTEPAFAAEMSVRSSKAFGKYSRTQLVKTYDEAWERVLAAYALWTGSLKS